MKEKKTHPRAGISLGEMCLCADPDGLNAGHSGRRPISPNYTTTETMGSLKWHRRLFFGEVTFFLIMIKLSVFKNDTMTPRRFGNADVSPHDSTHLLGPDLKRLITDCKKYPSSAARRDSFVLAGLFSFSFFLFFTISSGHADVLSWRPCLDEDAERSRVCVCAGDQVQMGRQASQKVTVVVLLFRKVMVWMLERIFRWCPARVTPMCRRSLEQREKGGRVNNNALTRRKGARGRH